MNVIICKDKRTVAKEAYKIVRDRVMNCRAKDLGLPTGSTPEGLYSQMVRGTRRVKSTFPMCIPSTSTNTSDCPRTTPRATATS